MQDKLEEKDWEMLLGRIKDGKCTPFLGAGACFGTLPLGSEIAREWAQAYDYPLKDSTDLARVAQFVAVQYDPMFPKEKILKRLNIDNVEPPDFKKPELLLSIELKFITDLDKEIISKELRRAFENTPISLSQSVIVYIAKKDNMWLLTDQQNNQTYVVRKGQNELNIYEADEPHAILADLPLPVYMTTNYDNFMVKALISRNKDPKRELCQWNERVKQQPSVFESETGFTPTPANPVVFHLHGHNKVAESLVLTEDDYLDFLVSISRDQDLLPPRIQQSIAGTSLLFMGYSLQDWDFRVLFRGLVTSTEPSLRRISVTAQLRPPKSPDEVRLKNGDRISGEITKDSDGNITVKTEALSLVTIEKKFVQSIVVGRDNRDEAKAKQEEYLEQYFGRINMRVYWGTAAEFATELRQHWEEFSNGA